MNSSKVIRTDVIGTVEYYTDLIASYLKRYGAALLTVSVLLLGYFSLNLSADPDLFARVAVGRLISNLGYVTTTDPFAFTPKNPLWIDHEWLSGVIFYSLSQLGGDTSLFLFKCGVVALTIAFLLRSMRLEIGGGESSFLILLIVSFGSAYLWTSTVRSQIFTYLFLAYLFFAILSYDRKGSLRYLLSFPFVMVVWHNLHGGFVVGLGILLIYSLSLVLKSWKAAVPPLLILLAAFGATAFNPYGFFLYWDYIIHAVSMHRPAITEWRPLIPWSEQAILPDVIVLLVLYGVYLNRAKLDPGRLAILLAAAFYAYRHERLSAVFLFSAATVGAVYVQNALAEIGKYFGARSERIRRAFVVVIGICVIGSIGRLTFLIGSKKFQLDYSAYPVEAVEWLWNYGGGGKLLVDFNNGSFAMWRLFPRYQISMDGRYEEVYPQKTVNLVDSAFNPKDPGFNTSIEEAKPNFILLSSELLKIRQNGFKNAGFSPVYSDPNFSVLKNDMASVQSGIVPSVESGWVPRF